MTAKEQENIIKVKNVISTMAIEEMYFNREFIQDMIKVANGKLSSEEVRRAVIKKYGR